MTQIELVISHLSFVIDMHNDIVSIDEASHWIRAQFAQQGIRIIGDIEQAHVRPWSIVLRVPTEAGHVFFKAVTPTLGYEAGVTNALAQLLPGSLPTLLAVDAQRGWLLMADGGTRLREVLKADRDLGHWHGVLAEYAKLQITVAPQLRGLIALGLPDARPATLPKQFAQLLADDESLCIGSSDGLTADEHTQLLALAANVTTLCEQLANSPVPESIDHGDLHDGNIFFNGGHSLLFDWGDSSAGHPFVSLRAVFVSIENTLGLEEGASEFQGVRDIYLAQWERFASPAELRSVFDAAMRLAPLCAALRWHRAIGALEPTVKADYAHAIPSLLRELLTGLGR